MKKIYKYLLMTIIASSTLFYSCETLELEDLASPNSLDASKADPDLLLNSIQLAYRANQIIFNDRSAELSRIDYFFGRDYFEALTAGTLNGVWTRFYSNDGSRGIVQNLKAIEAINAANPDVDLSFHIGIGKIMEAHNLMQLVDFIGDIPWSEAANPAEFPKPTVDNSQDVYTAAIAILNEAKAMLNGASGGSADDLYYGGDADKWIKLANTLLMRANLTVGNYSLVVSASNVIEDTADDFEFAYGTQVLSPDTRHPDYEADYRSDGANIYQSHWLMDLMIGEFGDFTDAFGGEGITDPRRRYYFFRQNWRSPLNYSLFEDVLDLLGGGAGAIWLSNGPDNGETLQCSLQDVPLHLQFTPDEAIWCSLPLGYWGRMHGNDEGIPPDNFTRTAVGVYPAGGSFDWRSDAFPYIGESISASWGQQVGLGNGGGGAGIEPIMLASYAHFMKAEASLILDNTGTAAAAHMEAGMRASIAKVMSFGSLDGGADMSQVPDQTTIDDFVTRIVAKFNAAPFSTGLLGNGFPDGKDKMDILGEQYFVALFGGSADAFNFIRRTGYPRTLTRNIEPNPGLFPRTFLYPSNEVSTNPSIIQRTDLTTKTFWDQGVTNPSN
ncbi:MAG: SusD/RagB family nutrient-binding outer membrane lipoprotein [Bacteroidetes bacterium]|nr:SusD/RagB family nutrient-binding outer membrane lipoprotein [Bacteroidota bacterium]